MFKRKKKKTGVQTPEFRKPTMPPNPNFGWQPKKPRNTNPPNVGSSVQPPKPHTSGSNAHVPPQLTIPPMPPVKQPQPPTSGSSVQAPKKPCLYETPCGYCTKWDKKCDKKIGPEVIPMLQMPDHVAENIIENVKSRTYEFCGVSENVIKENNE